MENLDMLIVFFGTFLLIILFFFFINFNYIKGSQSHGSGKLGGNK